jgi:hypothetical protein
MSVTRFIDKKQRMYFVSVWFHAAKIKGEDQDDVIYYNRHQLYYTPLFVSTRVDAPDTRLKPIKKVVKHYKNNNLTI